MWGLIVPNHWYSDKSEDHIKILRPSHILFAIIVKRLYCSELIKVPSVYTEFELLGCFSITHTLSGRNMPKIIHY